MRNAIKRLDPRLRRVWIPVAVAWAATALVAYLLKGTFGDSAWQAIGPSFYASWAEDVLFFTFITIALTYILHTPASAEPFDQRVQMLFGLRDEVGLKEHLKSEVRRLGAHATQASRQMFVEDYDKTHDAYRVRVVTTYVVANLLRDETYRDVVRVAVSPDPFDPVPPEVGRVTQITLDGQSKLAKGPQPIDPVKGFAAAIAIEIPKNRTAIYSYEYWALHKVGELNEMEPQRFADVFTCEMVNNMKFSEGVPQVQIEGTTQPVVLGNRLEFDPVNDAVPRSSLYRFTFLPPRR